MRRASLAIAELKRKIESAKERKKKLTDYVSELEHKYRHSLISYEDYNRILRKSYDGKTLSQRISEYDLYIKKYAELIRKEERRNSNKRVATYFFGVLFVFALFYFVQLDLNPTGFSVEEGGEGNSNEILPSDEVPSDETGNGDVVSENEEETIPTEEIVEEESVNDESEEILDESTNETQSEELESNDSELNETNVPEENSSIIEENNISHSEENITEANNSEASPSLEPPLTSGNETWENVTGTNVTTNQTSNETIGEILNETILNETILNETILNETILNETFLNFSSNMTIETQNSKIVVGRPVKWIKVINFENVSENETFSIKVPKEAENISIKTGSEIEKSISELEEYENLLNETPREEIRSGSALTGFVSLDVENGGGFLVNIFEKIGGWISSLTLTGKAVDEVIMEEETDVTENDESIEVDLTDVSKTEEEVLVEYYTEAPIAFEEETLVGKRITISTTVELNYTNVLAYTELNNKISLGEKEKITLYWNNNETGSLVREEVNFSVYDLDNDGNVDYLEWIVPHLSEQVYDLIIEIESAEHLYENKTFVSDIYSNVSSLDNIWSETINENEFVRVRFEKNLTSERDITVYPRIVSGSPRIEIYEKDGSDLIAEFISLNENTYNKVFLTNLEGTQDSFDLKIVGGSVEFDHIIDPAGAVGGLVVYGEGTQILPRYRNWTSDFSSEQNASTLGTGSVIQRVVVKSSTKRNETAVVIGDDDGDILLSVRNNANGNFSPWIDVASIGTTNDNYRGFDVAREHNSGDFVVVYETNITDDRILSYRTWNGTNWSSEGQIALNSDVAAAPQTYVSMIGKSGSDEIMLASWGNSTNNDLSAVRWDGDSWENVTTIGLAGAAVNEEHFSIAWESSSGNAMIAWGNGTTDASYNIFYDSNKSWSPVGQIRNRAAVVQQITLCSDPNSNYIGAIIGPDSTGDVLATIWNGSVWVTGEPGEEGAAENVAMKNSFCSWTTNSDVALFGYVVDGALNITYFQYNRTNNAWTCPEFGNAVTDLDNVEGTNGPCDSARSGPQVRMSDDIEVLRMVSDPDSNDIMILGMDLAEDLEMFIFNGTHITQPSTALLEQTTTTIAANEPGDFDYFRMESGEAEDTTSPTWSSNSTNSTLSGTNVLHSVLWADNTALSGYIFSFDNGTGTFVNDSFVIMTGTSNYSNVTKLVNLTVGSTIRWVVYSNDSSGNLNSTSIFSYNTTSLADTTSPTWSLNSTNSTIAGTNILHSVTWNDNIGLSGYIFSFDNGTGAFSNDSFVPFSGTTNWSNVTKYVNETINSTIRWIVYSNDSSGNMNSTNIFSYNTTEQIFDYFFGPINITANNDDGWIIHGYSSSWFPSGDSGQISPGYWQGNDRYAWGYFRFILASDIPSGSTITDYSTLTLNRTSSYSWDSAGDSRYLHIYAEKSANASQVTTHEDDPGVGSNPRNLTGNYTRFPSSGITTWTVDNGAEISPSLAPVIQELVDTYGGLNAGDYIQFWVRSNDEIGFEYYAGTTDSSSNPALSAKLNLGYSLPGGSDTTFPTWSSNSTNSTLSGTNVLHSVRWTDNTALSGYIFSFDNGTGTFVNDSFAQMTGTTNYSNVTKFVNSTVGSTIRWVVYSNDSSGNLNSTNIFSYDTTQDLSYSINLTKIYPTGNINATQNQFFNVTINVTCAQDNCGEINSTLIRKSDSVLNYLDHFIDNNSRWNWTGTSGAGYNTVPISIDGLTDTVLESGVTSAASASSYSDSSLRETSETHPQNRSVTWRLKTNVEDPTGNLGFGFWNGAAPGTDSVLFWYAGTSSCPAGFDGFRVFVMNDDTFLHNDNLTGIINLSEWHTYKIVRKTTGVDFYIDGVLVSNYSGASSTENFRNEVWIDNHGFDGSCAPTNLDLTRDEIVYVDYTYIENLTSVSETVPLNSGSPFYTNTTNPYNLSLNSGESSLVTWFVNSTGYPEVDSRNTFVVYSNMTSNMSVSNLTNDWNITILEAVNSQPTVSIIYPPNASIFNNGTNITINATASDIDGTVSFVEFYRNGTFIGNDSSSPYATTNWTNAQIGNYTLTARAYDNDGSSTYSSNVTVYVTEPVQSSFLVELISPTGSANSPVTFISNVSYEDELKNATLYTNESGGSWVSKETRWNGEVPYNSTDLVILVHFNNETQYGENYTQSYDWSGKGNNGSCAVAQCPSGVNGKFGSARYFDGGDMINVPESTSLSSFDNGLTVNVWLNISADTAQTVLTHVGDAVGYSLYGGSWYTGNGGWIPVNAGLVADNNWHMYSVKWNTTHYISYRDGVELDLTSATGLTFNASKLTLGGDNRFDSATFTGGMDEFSIWNRSLDSSELASLYNYTQVSFIPEFQKRTLGDGFYMWNVLGYSSDLNSSWGESNFTFTVGGADTTSPTWSSNSSNGTRSGTNVLHSVRWADNTALAGYIFSFDNGTGTFVNDSFAQMTGTSNYSNVTKYINETVGTTIQWIVYSNDSSGNLNSTSTFSYLTVSNSPPSVSITSPSNLSTYNNGTNITINASASDTDGTVSFVEFYRNGTFIGNDSSSPYATTNWTNAQIGNYTLTARAYDNDGSSTYSSNVTVYVEEQEVLYYDLFDGANNTPLNTYDSRYLNARTNGYDVQYLLLDGEGGVKSSGNTIGGFSFNDSIVNEGDVQTSQITLLGKDASDTILVRLLVQTLHDGDQYYGWELDDISDGEYTSLVWYEGVQGIQRGSGGGYSLNISSYNLDVTQDIVMRTTINYTSPTEAVVSAYAGIVGNSLELLDSFTIFSNGTYIFGGVTGGYTLTFLTDRYPGMLYHENNAGSTRSLFKEFYYGESQPSNSAPTVPFVQSISSQNPTEDATTAITFNFTVTDSDGASNINTSSAKAYFQKSGETTRSNISCLNYTAVGNSINFSCTINMWYFDDAGTWTINVTASDNSGSVSENSSTTFTYNLLTAMKISPSSLGWPELSLTDTNIGSSNNPVLINNTGNDETLDINVTAYDLLGEANSSHLIYANNFTISNVTAGCSGDTMSNATSINISSAVLARGNHSLNDGSTGQEQIYFCLKGVPPTISSQSYSSSAYGSWIISIFMVLLIPKRKKKISKKEVEKNNLLSIFEIITDKLKEDYSLDKKELLEVILNKLKEKYEISEDEISTVIKKSEFEIPTSVLNNKLGSLESVVKYMKENLNMRYVEIAHNLERDERTIWTSYKMANKKFPQSFEIKGEGELIPVSIFKEGNLTILESIIIHLKKRGLKYSEIAKVIKRDQRNVWTVYSRALKKLNKTL